MSIFKDWHLYVVILTVAITTIPKLTMWLSHPVIDGVVIVLGAILVALNLYETKQAYVDGANKVVGSKYK